MIRFTKARPKPKIPPKPKGSKKVILNKLKSFLTATEPKAIEFLVSFWNTQAQGLTYKELREAYLAGEITEQRYQQWTQDYSLFIQNKLSPLWQQAANTAAAEVAAQYPKFIYEPSVSAAMDFIKNHGAELVTNITQEQRKALNAVIAHISGYTAVTPDEAARMIRPVVGLTVPQAVANVRHRQAVEQAYLKAHPNCRPETAKKKADEASARYAGKQHRYRAQNIARTELAFAYNAGSYGATKDAQAQGYIGDCVKIWLTAYDERVCHICERMDGEKRNIDEKFSNGKMIPPGHPSCRCAVAYEEIPGTNLNPIGVTGGREGAVQEEPPHSAPAQAEPALTLNPTPAQPVQQPRRSQAPVDVTQEYLRAATPGKGTITYEDGYRTKGHQDEIKMADWIYRTFGGDIKLLKEAGNDSIKRPDYLWNEVLWELKGAHSVNAADKRLQYAIKQIKDNPGGVILDVLEDMDMAALERQLTRRFYRPESEINSLDLMILSKGEFVKIMRYKK